MPTTAPPAGFRAGLALLAVLSLGDVATPFLTDGENPPFPVAVLVMVLGLVSLALVALAFRDPSRPVRLLVGLRVLSAVAALPAFVVDGVPTPAVVAAAAVVVLTAAGVLLVGRGRPELVTA